jgi:signal transduction histidine kinase
LTLAFTNPSDNLSNDVLDKAFERFYRGSGEHSRSTDGHGLGLSLCKEIIRLHHGAIKIRKNERHEVCVSIEVNLRLQPTIDSLA